MQDIMTQGQQLQAQQEKLIEGERTLQAKVESFRTQKEMIKAKYTAAEAQTRINEAVSGHRRGDGRRRPGDPARQGQDRSRCRRAPARSTS